MDKFEFNGKKFEKRENGYCFCDGKRIGCKEFDEVKTARTDRIAKTIKTDIDNDGEEHMNKIEINGVEYVNDWANGKYYKDGIEISKREFNKAIGIRTDSDSKTSKPRRSKDIAYEGQGVTLTTKQVDFIRELNNTDVWSMKNGAWADQIVDQIGGQFARKPMTIGAMISTLREKGLLETETGYDEHNGRTRKVKVVSPTDCGKKVIKEIMKGE